MAVARAVEGSFADDRMVAGGRACVRLREGAVDEMTHRHLNVIAHYSSAAIDDIIGRGSLADWVSLCRAADADHSIFEKILRVCAAKVGDPHEQRYHLWKYHAEHAIA